MKKPKGFGKFDKLMRKLVKPVKAVKPKGPPKKRK
jgi:hypothetical protein